MMRAIISYLIIFIAVSAMWYLGFRMGKATPCNDIEQSDIWPEIK